MCGVQPCVGDPRPRMRARGLSTESTRSCNISFPEPHSEIASISSSDGSQRQYIVPDERSQFRTIAEAG